MAELAVYLPSDLRRDCSALTVLLIVKYNNRDTLEMTDYPRSDGLTARFSFSLHETFASAFKRAHRLVGNNNVTLLMGRRQRRFPQKTITVQLESITFDISQLLSKTF